MGSEFENTATKPLSERQPMCDGDILRLLADQHGHSIAEMAGHFRVTQTAIRNRLQRLEHRERIVRQREESWRQPGTPKRGRPRYLYFITSRGEAALQEPPDAGAPGRPRRNAR
jgi:predicted ArsR family transcriptional regulator